MQTVEAPAKLNLVLEVLGKRSDGYHEIRSLVQTVDLCDSIHITTARDLSLECSEPSLEGPDNLVLKAAGLLREASGFRGGARIRLTKRVPWAVGLGGGSSDAAAILCALNDLWALGLTPQRLLGMAAAIGSDVPFFVRGGTALLEGRGEIVRPLPDLVSQCFVVAVPPIAVPAEKTKHLYGLLSPPHFTGGAAAAQGSDAVTRGEGIKHIRLFNVFEEVAFSAFPGLDRFWQRAATAGGGEVRLCGSGPALFMPVDSRAKAEVICRGLRRDGLRCYVVNSLPCRTRPWRPGLPGGDRSKA